MVEAERMSQLVFDCRDCGLVRVAVLNLDLSFVVISSTDVLIDRCTADCRLIIARAVADLVDDLNYDIGLSGRVYVFELVLVVGVLPPSPFQKLIASRTNGAQLLFESVVSVTATVTGSDSHGF
nr:hypothetical protein [Halolamina pelagica]